MTVQLWVAIVVALWAGSFLSLLAHVCLRPFMHGTERERAKLNSQTFFVAVATATLATLGAGFPEVALVMGAIFTPLFWASFALAAGVVLWHLTRSSKVDAPNA